MENKYEIVFPIAVMRRILTDVREGVEKYDYVNVQINDNTTIMIKIDLEEIKKEIGKERFFDFLSPLA